MKRKTLFVTGTDTDVGKTVLTVLLLKHLLDKKQRVAAFKPICSGGRMDAQIIHDAMGGAMPLDEINPWHFRAPLAPLLAARKERKQVNLTDVLAHIKQHSATAHVTLIEGAGGLMSPLGDDFDSRDLVVTLNAMALIVCPNRLGAVNQVMLTREALPGWLRVRARVVLMTPARLDAASESNAELLEELTGRPPQVFPRLSAPTKLTPAISQLLKQLIARI